jgi:outer membrane protein OmpA-like peptidoglycan-associated protein
MKKTTYILFLGLLLNATAFVNAQNKGDKKIITLRSYLEKYICVRTAEEGKVYADYQTPKDKATQLKVYDLGNDKVALKGVNDKYLSNQKGLIAATSIKVTDNETFTVIKVAPDWIALKANDGTYVSVNPKKNNQLISGKPTVAEWETFYITVIYDPVVKITDVTLSGSVVDDKTKLPIIASVEITNVLSGEVLSQLTTDETGKFTAKIPSNSKIAVYAKCEKYLPASQNMATTDQQTTAEVNLALVKMEVGGIVKLNNILFQTGKTTIKAESYPELDNIYQVFIDNPAMEVEISGHTDSDGSEAYNLKLSQERANAIKEYIVSKGIVDAKIKAVGYGETKPVASNDTEEGKGQNRRVEFKILKN